MGFCTSSIITRMQLPRSFCFSSRKEVLISPRYNPVYFFNDLLPIRVWLAARYNSFLTPYCFYNISDFLILWNVFLSQLISWEELMGFEFLFMAAASEIYKFGLQFRWSHINLICRNEFMAASFPRNYINKVLPDAVTHNSSVWQGGGPIYML